MTMYSYFLFLFFVSSSRLLPFFFVWFSYSWYPVYSKNLLVFCFNFPLFSTSDFPFWFLCFLSSRFFIYDKEPSSFRLKLLIKPSYALLKESLNEIFSFDNDLSEKKQWVILCHLICLSHKLSIEKANYVHF